MFSTAVYCEYRVMGYRLYLFLVVQQLSDVHVLLLSITLYYVMYIGVINNNLLSICHNITKCIYHKYIMYIMYDNIIL